MIDISIKKYMTIDLLSMIIIGLIVELIAMLVLPQVIPNAVPPFIVSLVIIMLALTRWGWKGIITIPIMSVGAWLFGKLLGEYKENYDIYYLISTFVGFFSSLLIILFKKKSKTNPFGDSITTLGITILVVALLVVLEIITFSLLTLTNPLDNTVWFLVQNVAEFVVTLIFVLALRRQGMFVDVKKDLIKKEKERQMENKYYSQYVNDVIVKNDDNVDEEDKTSKK